MLRLAAPAAVLLCAAGAFAQRTPLDVPMQVSVRQWLDLRLRVLEKAFPKEPRAQIALSPEADRIDVLLYWGGGGGLLSRGEEERMAMLRTHVTDPIERGIQNILSELPAQARGKLEAKYVLHFYRYDLERYVRVGSGTAQKINWDKETLAGFTQPDQVPAQMHATYEVREFQWLNTQLALWAAGSVRSDARPRCLISTERKVVCTLDATGARGAKTKSQERVSSLIRSWNKELEGVFAQHGREVRFDPNAMLEWNINLDEGKGAYHFGSWWQGQFNWTP
jgi:hypothetical protein